MSIFESEMARRPSANARLSTEDLNFALAAQIIVGWAGEGGEEKRLGWWRTDLASEFGGEDLFKRLLPNSSRWATLQAVREAARRKDTELRRRDADADDVVSLFSLGFEIDERLDERLQDLKRAGAEPARVLPGLDAVMTASWDKGAFASWAEGMGRSEVKAEPIGRRIVGDAPGKLQSVIAKLVGALVPVADAYPLPHFRRPA